MVYHGLMIWDYYLPDYPEMGSTNLNMKAMFRPFYNRSFLPDQLSPVQMRALTRTTRNLNKYGMKEPENALTKEFS
jgi:hypothetical protein